ncbi:endonuclease III [Kordiimonas aquimaris]|uniref:endonuclease III n=1 Tax=Kordiimonas aquimaris TaxID=707591 RepID=UPI0021D269B0|nr:endonuclease III [Kordiimonas aquimaris]
MAGKYSKLNRTDIFNFFDVLATDDPNPEGELDYVNPFTLLIAVLLSAQATDVGVNKATKNLWPIADTPEKMLALGLDGVKEHIKTIGLFNTKAKNVMKCCEDLVSKFGSQVPETQEELESLAGVGRKTALVVRNIAFGHPTCAVDTHIFRVSNRTGLAPGKNVLQVERALEKVIPEPFRMHAHHWLILHGRYICKARKPDCGKCKVINICKFKDKVL